MRAHHARGLKLGWASAERWPVVGRAGRNLPPERDPLSVSADTGILNKAGLRSETEALVAAYRARQPERVSVQRGQFASASAARQYGLNAYFSKLNGA